MKKIMSFMICMMLVMTAGCSTDKRSDIMQKSVIDENSENFSEKESYQKDDLNSSSKLFPLTIENMVLDVGEGYWGVVTLDRELYMWGDNEYGQLGNGSNEDSDTPMKIMDDVVQVSLGENHSAAITSDGSLYMWGNNELGQLGDGSYESSTVPIKVMDHVISVDLGSQLSGAVTSNGDLYMWGDNEYGQLGNGSSLNDSATPEKIMEGVGFISLASHHSAAITSDGSLYMGMEQ